MSTSTGVNVLRYSALGLGIFWGFYHQRSISSSQKTAAARREYEHKESLIQQAKAEYSKSKQPAASKQGGGNQDPSDSKFDMEAYINILTGENP